MRLGRSLFGVTTIAMAASILVSIFPIRPAAADGDPVIAAAGDIACDPIDSAFHGGVGTLSRCHEMYTGAQLVGGGFAAVLPLGDEQYECGGAAAFAQSYDPAWGVPAVKSISYPVVGNHEYNTSRGTNCGRNASGYFGYFGAAAGDPTKGYYSYDIGTWHLIALNSNCGHVACKAGSAQEVWLAHDLATHPNTCTLAYFHHPLFSAGPDTHSAVRPFWNDLYAARADVVLNGHKHNYQRLTKLNPSGAPNTNGIREFVAGTGGENHSITSKLYPGTEASDGGHFGILELTLHPAGYNWQFLSDKGSVIDSGSDVCVP
jgi:acid phosphatase type 7